MSLCKVCSTQTFPKRNANAIPDNRTFHRFAAKQINNFIFHFIFHVKSDLTQFKKGIERIYNIIFQEVWMYRKIFYRKVSSWNEFTLKNWDKSYDTLLYWIKIHKVHLNGLLSVYRLPNVFSSTNKLSAAYKITLKTLTVTPVFHI